jgi:biopolymer transport protein ExbB/TolQ
MTSNDESAEEGYQEEDAQNEAQTEDCEGAPEQEPNESAPKRKSFFNLRLKKVRKAKTPRRSILSVSKLTAGAGIVGLAGFFGLFIISMLLFITENYFLSMFVISLALMVYSTGIDFVKLLLSSFTIFISTKHLLTKAVYLSETLRALGSSILISRTVHGELKVAPIREHQAVTLPDNSLTRDIRDLVDNDEGIEYADAIAHSYFVDCHELYSYSHANMEFVANAMPLFGLIGTILGLISMFDGLGSDVTVETLTPQLALALKTTLYGAVFSSLYKIIGSRFEQRQKFLEYDFDTFSRLLEVLISHKNTIQVAQ